MYKDFLIALCWRPHTGEIDAYHPTLHVPNRRWSPAERMYSCLDLVALVNHNESLNICFMRCDLILAVCMKERERALSVDIHTVNIQTIHLMWTAEHSSVLLAQMLFEGPRAARSGDMPHYSSLTQAYSLLLPWLLIKKPFEPPELTFIIGKTDGGQSLPIFRLQLFICNTAVRCGSLPTDSLSEAALLGRLKRTK